MTRVMALLFGLWFPAAALAANPAATYTGTVVENVDTGKQTVSIKTKEGQSWTLRVADPALLAQHNLRKGDKVSVEVDTNNQVTKIAKAEDSGSSGGMGQGRSQQGIAEAPPGIGEQGAGQTESTMERSGGEQSRSFQGMAQVPSGIGERGTGQTQSTLERSGGGSSHR